jgi:hypothetical protein
MGPRFRGDDLKRLRPKLVALTRWVAARARLNPKIRRLHLLVVG